MRERNRLAAGIEGLTKLEADVADAIGLIGLAEAEGEPEMVAEGIASLRTLAGRSQAAGDPEPAIRRGRRQ